MYPYDGFTFAHLEISNYLIELSPTTKTPIVAPRDGNTKVKHDNATRNNTLHCCCAVEINHLETASFPCARLSFNLDHSFLQLRATPSSISSVSSCSIFQQFKGVFFRITQLNWLTDIEINCLELTYKFYIADYLIEAGSSN